MKIIYTIEDSSMLTSQDLKCCDDGAKAMKNLLRMSSLRGFLFSWAMYRKIEKTGISYIWPLI